MRDWPRRARLAIALLVSQTALAAPAFAGNDMVVMPFRCDVVDGKPVLTPAKEEHGHRILDEREAQKVLTCSTVDKKRCRQWTAFKFDMDCGGARVPWMKVFANASDHTRRRAWEHNGSLRVRNTPERNPRVDEMCARRLGPRLDWTNISEVCDQISPLDAPTTTAMPAGFAPMVGLDAAILPAETYAKIAARSGRSVAKEDKLARTAAAAKPSPPKPKVVVAEQSAIATGAVADTPPAQERKLEHVPLTVAQASTAEPAALNVTEVDDRPPSPPQPDAARVAEANEPSEAAPTAAPVVLNASEPVEQHAPPTPPESTPPVVSAVDVDTAPSSATAEIADTNVAYLIVALAGGLLMVTFLCVHWFGHAKTAVALDPVDREDHVASVPRQPQDATPASLANSPDPATILRQLHQAQSPGATSTAIMLRPERRDTRADANTQIVRTRNRLSIGDSMPKSKHEALELLGMGVASDDNLSSLKKIIDGLRMNWHPDLASSELDRRTRELRLKQINAAWEILGGKTVGA